jgi:hypothetical protein
MVADPPCMNCTKFSTIQTNIDADNDFMDKRVQWDEDNCTVVMIDDVAITYPVFHATMEHIKAMERHAIMVLHHNVEHENNVSLLRVLEDTQCLLL